MKQTYCKWKGFYLYSCVNVCSSHIFIFFDIDGKTKTKCSTCIDMKVFTHNIKHPINILARIDAWTVLNMFDLNNGKTDINLFGSQWRVGKVASLSTERHWGYFEAR